MRQALCFSSVRRPEEVLFEISVEWLLLPTETPPLSMYPVHCGGIFGMEACIPRTFSLPHAFYKMLWFNETCSRIIEDRET